MGTKNFSNYSDMITFSRASTGTYLDSDGLLKSAATNTPRVEYDYQGNRLGLLVEEARTNLMTHSEDFSSWANFSIASANDAVGPDGVSNSATTGTASGGTSYFFKPATTSSGTATFSVFVKAGTATVAWLYWDFGSINGTAYFDLSDETTQAVAGSGQTPTNLKIEPYGDYYRISATWVVTAKSANFGVGMSDVKGTITATAGKTLVVYGAQLEAGTFPTSYIPTTGATATRSADVASIGVGAFGYNKGAGTVLITLDSAETADFPGAVAFNGNSGANRWYLYSSAGTWAARQFINNVGTGTINLSAVEASAETKLALALKGSSASAVKDGGSVVNNATFPIPPLIDEMEIGDGPGGVTQLNGHIKSLSYFPRRLTNAQLQSLTE